MAGISLNYNGIELSQWFDVTDVQRNIGTSHVNSMTKIGQSDGQLWQYMSRDTKTITISGIVTNTNLANLRRELGAALDVDEPAQLIIGDDTDVYYLAVYDGQPTIAEDWRSGTISLTFTVPDGIAHSVATKTADNMPYKDVPVNFVIASHASGSNTTSADSYPINLQLSEDLSGKTITTSAKVIVTNYQGKVTSTNAAGPYIDIKDGQSTGKLTGLINQIPITGDGVYTSLPTTMTKHILTGTTNTVSVEMYNLSATIEVWIKVELGTTASPWSPNPADSEYYTDTIIVPNSGTYPVYPIIEVTMHSDNGYVGLASSDGSYLEFGSAEEVDGVTKQKSERVLYAEYDEPPANVIYNKAATNYPNFGSDPTKPNKQQGTIAYANTAGLDPSKGSGAMPTFVNGSEGYWGGPSMTLPIAPNSDNNTTGNFLMKTRFYFATSTHQQGRLEITLQNGDSVAYEAVFRDSSPSQDYITVEFWVQGKELDSFNLNRKLFTNGMYRELMISKMGTEVTFQIAAVTGFKAGDTSIIRSATVKNYNLSSVYTLPVTAYSVWYERYQDTNHVLMDVTDTQFQWVNVDYWADLPNRFTSGDVVTIDTAQRKVYVNGVEDLTLQTIGNQWDHFSLQPGETSIESVVSSWANSPTVKIDFQEAYV